MLSVKRLLSFKSPGLLGLIDIALILALIPHFFALNGLITLFVIIAIMFIRKKERLPYDTALLFAIGMVVIVLAFFNTYNFSDFSRMQFFISFVSAMLIVAVALQRLTKEINFYLKISPALLLLLSFFFFDTISMLFYSLFVFFVFVLLMLWSRMDDTLGELLRFNTALFLLSLPAVVVLFIAFPRISFEKADFGFRGEGYSSGEYDGSMSVSEKPFVPSNKLVMELYFKAEIPSEEKLYFRGSVLYPVDASRWEERDEEGAKEFLRKVSSRVSYDVLLYPHAKKWLYALDVPTKEEYKKSKLQNDYTLRTQKQLYEKKRFSMESALEYELLSPDVTDALEYNKSIAPKTLQALRKIQEQKLSPQEKALALVEFFKNQKLSYTTTPQGLDSTRMLDSFLFEAKNGYCTHFAASFAMAARMLGIPSRVISGFKADYSNRVENYLVIKLKDAHAWVELYFEDVGWKRFEPTATAMRNLDLLKEQNRDDKESLFNALNMQYMYIKYLINNWVLGFDRFKQLAILDKLLNDTIYLAKFVGAILGVVLLSFLLFYFVKSFQRGERVSLLMQTLLHELGKRDLRKQPNETMRHFLQRAEVATGVSTKRVTRSYELLKYAKTEGSYEELEIAVKTLRKELRTL